MRRQGAGHIENVASVVGKRASPVCAAYVASKPRWSARLLLRLGPPARAR